MTNLSPRISPKQS